MILMFVICQHLVKFLVTFGLNEGTSVYAKMDKKSNVASTVHNSKHIKYLRGGGGKKVDLPQERVQILVVQYHILELKTSIPVTLSELKNYI